MNDDTIQKIRATLDEALTEADKFDSASNSGAANGERVGIEAEHAVGMAEKIRLLDEIIRVEEGALVVDSNGEKHRITIEDTFDGHTYIGAEGLEELLDIADVAWDRYGKRDFAFAYPDEHSEVGTHVSTIAYEDGDSWPIEVMVDQLPGVELVKDET